MSKVKGKRQKAKAAAPEAPVSPPRRTPVTAEAVEPPKIRQADLGVESIRSDGNHREGKVDVASLAASIARDGLLQPLIVCQSVKGTYAFQVLDGRRRLAAVKQLGWKSVSVVILNCSKRDRQEALAAVANLERRDLTPVEEGLAVARLLKTLGGKQDDLERGAAPTAAIERAAALLGRSPAWVRDRGLLLRLCPEVRALVATGRLPLAQAREIAKLASAADQREVARHASGVWEDTRRPDWLKKGDEVNIQSVATVRLEVAARLSMLRGVPWKPEVAFAGQRECTGCSDNSENTLLYGVDSGDKAPEARCLNTKCYLAKMRAAERALTATVTKAKADKKIAPTEAGVRGVTPSYLKPGKVARELERVRGGGTKKGKAGGAPEEKEKEIPWEQRPEAKFQKATYTWTEKVLAVVGADLRASSMRVACFVVGIQSPGFTRHIGYSDTPPKAVRSRIEPILKRIASGTVEDLKVLTEGFGVGELFDYNRTGVPLWVVRHLAGLLDVNLPAEPKLEDFMPKPAAEKPTKAGV